MPNELVRHRLPGQRRRKVDLAAREFDEGLRDTSPEASYVVASWDPTNATLVSLRLYDLDRELRRAANLFNAGLGRSGTPSGKRPSPLPIRQGGLEIQDVRMGSVDFLLVPFGLLEQVLASQPMAAFLALVDLAERGGHLRAWVRRRSTKLASLTPATALDQLAGFSPTEELGSPDVDVGVKEGRVLARGREARLRTPEGIEVVGGHIKYVQERSDGTVVFIEADR
jgi:hypothetical protein